MHETTGRVGLLCGLLISAAAYGQTPDAADSAGEPFDVLEIRVLGNSTLEPAQIERALYPYVGPQRSMTQLEQGREALAALYRERGFGAATVDIPEQQVTNGIVRFKVTEGRLDRIRITGARYFSNGAIRERLGTRPGEVLQLGRLQEDLNTLNRQTGDRSITPVLRAGRTPGMVDLELKVEDELPVHGSVEVNDRYTADTSKTRVGATLAYNNLFQRFHSLSFQYQTSPEEPDETRVIAGTYVAPLSNGHSIAAYAVDTNSDVATVGTLSVLGAGRIYGLRYVVPVTQGRQQPVFHTISFGADYKDFAESIRLSDSTDTTPIQYLNWSLLYNLSWRPGDNLWSFGIGANFGVRGWGNDAGPAIEPDQQFYVPGEFGYKRAGAEPNYFYLRADATHERLLWGKSQLALRASGQFTTEPLISNEQFSIGGAESIRGYLESEELGDYGVSGSLEWRTPAYLRKWTWGDLAAYGLVFYDAGIVAVVDPLPEQESQKFLSSAGLGFRLSGLGGLDAAIDWAYPLEDTDRIEAHDGRIHFRVLYGF